MFSWAKECQILSNGVSPLEWRFGMLRPEQPTLAVCSSSSAKNFFEQVVGGYGTLVFQLVLSCFVASKCMCEWFDEKKNKNDNGFSNESKKCCGYNNITEYNLFGQKFEHGCDMVDCVLIDLLAR